MSIVTTSMRFGGELNLDLNELGQNLAPFPELNFVSAALSGPETTIPAAIRALTMEKTQLTGRFCAKTLAAACLTRGGSSMEVISGVQ